MNSVSGYCYCAICVTASSSILLSLFSVRGAAKRHVRFLCGLCICSVLIAPIRQIPFDLSDIVYNYSDATEAVYDEKEYRRAVVEELKSELEETIAEMIKTRFDVECEKCEVIINENEGEITLEEVFVTIDGSEFLKSDVEKFIENNLECDVDIIDNE